MIFCTDSAWLIHSLTGEASPGDGTEDITPEGDPPRPLALVIKRRIQARRSFKINCSEKHKIEGGTRSQDHSNQHALSRGCVGTGRVWRCCEAAL
jgi:hypothetical protein